MGSEGVCSPLATDGVMKTEAVCSLTEEVMESETVCSQLATNGVIKSEAVCSPLAADRVTESEAICSQLAINGVIKSEAECSPSAMEGVMEREAVCSQLETNEMMKSEAICSPLATDRVTESEAVCSTLATARAMESKAICSPLASDGVMVDENSKQNQSKRSNEWVVDASELETLNKKAKEFSNDEANSEVLNPHVSPQENACSSQTISSDPADLIAKSDCGDAQATSTSNTIVEVIENDSRCRNDSSTSEVVLEDPKSSNASGIKRIIFKFSKSKDVTNGLSSSVSHSDIRFHVEPRMNPSELVDSRASMLEGTSRAVIFGIGLRDMKSRMKFKTSKKDFSNSYPTNVRKLLSTRILEGAKVKYIKEGKELLSGMISGTGYLCGCGRCSFSIVLNAYEFEQHAGCKTKHPNNHIFLINGKSIYSIVQEMRNVPLDSFDGVIQTVAGPSVNEQSYLIWKESSETENIQQDEGMRSIYKHSHLDRFELPRSVNSCPGQGTDDGDIPATSSWESEFAVQENFKEQKWGQKSKKKSQLRRMDLDTSKSVVRRKDTNGRVKKRDNDLHRLLFMPNGLPDGAGLTYFSKGQSILEGYKHGNGIVCSCCHSEISPSQFEAHAGWSTRRQPYRHIYTSNGKSLHDLSLSLANGQSVAASDSDMCAVCGDGGDLILCDGCPRGFHSVCLDLKCIPEDGWYCPYCKDTTEIAGSESCSAVRPITIRLKRVVKAPKIEIGGCVVCRAHDFSVDKFDDRTVMLCDQCEKEYHVGCLRDRGLCHLEELPEGKWFCCEDCSRINAALQDMIFTGAEVIPASLSNSISRKLFQRGSTDEVGEIRWQLLSGKIESSEHRSLLSRAAAIFRGSFDPIVEKSGHDLIPPMVYGRNVAGLEFGGMYCAVLTVKSVVVSAGVLRIFGKEVAELPLVATIKANQGKGYFQALFSCIERFLCGLNVENLVLPATEEAESIWTNKFGFRKMPDDRFDDYARDFQLMTFKGTSMLEKAVPRMTEEQPAPVK